MSSLGKSHLTGAEPGILLAKGTSHCSRGSIALRRKKSWLGEEQGLWKSEKNASPGIRFEHTGLVILTGEKKY